MKKGFEINCTSDLEVKLVDRMNDMIKALTKNMADRVDTRKNFRLIEKQVRNIFDIMVFLL